MFTGHAISLDFKDGDLTDILRLFADISGLNVVVNPGVAGRMSLKLVEVPWDQALDLILRTHGLAPLLEGNVLRIGRAVDFTAEANERRALSRALSGQGVPSQKPTPSSGPTIVYFVRGNLVQHSIDKNSGQVIFGDVNGVAMNRTAATRLNDSFNVVTHSQASNDLKTALADLHGAVAQLVENVPQSAPTSAEDIANQLDVFAKQAIEKKPIEGILKVSGKGLVEAAEFVSKAASVSIQLAPLVNKVSQLLGYPPLV